MKSLMTLTRISAVPGGCITTHRWWPYLNCELIVKSRECKPGTAIGKNLKSVIPAKQFQPHIRCAEPNQEPLFYTADLFKQLRIDLHILRKKKIG